MNLLNFYLFEQAHPGEVEIKCLMKKLKKENSEEKQLAAWTLANLAAKPSNRASIIHHDGIKVFTEILRTEKESIRVHALRVFTCLSYKKIYREQLVTNGAVQPIIRAIKMGRCALVEHGIELLANLALVQDARGNSINI